MKPTKAGILALSITMVAPLLVAGASTSVEPPAHSATIANVEIPQAVAAETISGLSESVASISGSPTNTIHLAAAGDELSLAQAAANAGSNSSIALMAPSTDIAAIRSQLSKFSPTTIRPVGSPSSFSPDLLTALATDYVVDQSSIAVSSFGRSAAVGATEAPQKIVVTESTSAEAQALATSLAISTSSALLILDGQEATADTVAVLENTATTQITIVGEVPTLATYQDVSQAVANKTLWLDTTTQTTSEQSAIQAMIAAGRNAPRIVASTERTIAARALASVAARASDAVTSTESAASEYAAKLHSPLNRAITVGLTASQAKSEALAAAQPTPIAAPAFRVVNVVPTQDRTSHVVTTTAVAGATTYTAYDQEGLQVGTSAITSITVSGEPGPLAITASSASGQLAIAQLRINDYSESIDSTQIIVGTFGDGRNSLHFLGGTNTPRLITRTKISPFGATIPNPDNDTVVLGITCLSSFTDAPLDGLNQYDYVATTISNSRETCGGEHNEAPESRPLVSGVTFPATEFPAFDSSPNSEPDHNSAPRASRSVLDQAIANATSAAERRLATGSDGTSISAAGDGWPDITFRYQGFIRKDMVPGLVSTEDRWRPYPWFHGDNRGANAKGSVRHRQDVTIKFGTYHAQNYSEHMGQTILYKCRWPWGSDCTEKARATASLSQLSMAGSVVYNTRGQFTLVVAATNPLQPGAPPINSRLTWKYGPKGTTIRGTHDRMPSHEIWFHSPGMASEWFFAYHAREVGLQCLYGFLPGCRASVNMRL